jgi:hypothetical protein
MTANNHHATSAPAAPPVTLLSIASGSALPRPRMPVPALNLYSVQSSSPSTTLIFPVPLDALGANTVFVAASFAPFGAHVPVNVSSPVLAALNLPNIVQSDVFCLNQLIIDVQTMLPRSKQPELEHLSATDTPMPVLPREPPPRAGYHGTHPSQSSFHPMASTRLHVTAPRPTAVGPTRPVSLKPIGVSTALSLSLPTRSVPLAAEVNPAFLFFCSHLNGAEIHVNDINVGLQAKFLRLALLMVAGTSHLVALHESKVGSHNPWGHNTRPEQVSLALDKVLHTTYLFSTIVLHFSH